VSRIDELIQEFCPEGVGSKLLGEVCTIKTGQPVSKVLISKNPGEYPVINSGREPLGFIDKFNTEDDPIGITSRGAGVGSVTWCPGKYYRGNLNYSVTIKDKRLLDVRFLYFLLMQNQPDIQRLATYQGIPALNKSNLEKLQIPIPPLEVQKEIVNILDKFTQLEAELSAELSAELDARRLQYEYYRNHLLAYEKSDSDIKWASLSDVTLSTKNIKWREVGSASYEYIDLSSVSRDDHSIIETTKVSSSTAPSRAQKLVQGGDIIFATTRPTLQRYTMINDHFDGQVASTGYCILRPNKEIVTSQWIYHNIAKSDFNNYVEKNQEGSAYPSISDSKVKAFVIPVPPISEQQRIVTLLDRFEKLVNDISIGLPAEIKSRHDQYEYYRTKLLTFQELSA